MLKYIIKPYIGFIMFNHGVSRSWGLNYSTICLLGNLTAIGSRPITSGKCGSSWILYYMHIYSEVMHLIICYYFWYRQRQLQEIDFRSARESRSVGNEFTDGIITICQCMQFSFICICMHALICKMERRSSNACFLY